MSAAARGAAGWLCRQRKPRRQMQAERAAEALKRERDLMQTNQICSLEPATCHCDACSEARRRVNVTYRRSKLSTAA